MKFPVWPGLNYQEAYSFSQITVLEFFINLTSSQYMNHSSVVCRHSIFAPSLHNSYASATFPGLHDALLDAVNNGSWSLVREELSNTIVAIEWAAQFLKSTV